MSQKISLISWNVNGIRAMVNKGLYDILKELDADIFCVQETKAQDDILHTISENLPDYHLYVTSAEKKGYSGTAIFTKIKPLNHNYGMGIDEHDTEGRLITLEYEKFFLVNVYVPNSGSELKRLEYREEWDKDLCKYLKVLDEKKPVVFTGDFNVAHEPIDLARPKPNYNKTAGYTQVEIDGISNFLNAGFIDTFRHFHKDKVQYTFWNMRFKGREKNIGWRIDYFLISERMIDQVEEASVLDQVMGSDHCPVKLVVKQ